MNIIPEQALKERLHLAELLAHKQLGTISSEEEQELAELLKDEHLKVLSEHILNDDIHSYQSSEPTDVQKHWNEFSRKYIHPSHPKMIRLFSYVGAIAAICIGVIFSIIRTTPELPLENETVATITSTPTNQINPQPKDSFSWKKGTKLNKDFAGRKHFSKCITDKMKKGHCLNVEKITTENKTVETRILTDNSRVILNENSILFYQKHFTSDKRETWLYGEAQFNVTKEPKRPFVVYAGPLEISVLGTQFNVQAYEEKEVKVTVIDGSVKVSSRTDAVTITPGYSAIYQRDTGKLEVKKENMYEVTAWAYNRFYHQGCSLKEVARILSEWYQIPIECKDEETAEKVIVLNMERYPSVYSALKRLVDMNILTYEYNEEENTIVISRTYR